MTPKLIGILGRSRMGKDTVAQIVCDMIGHENTTIHRLSKTLKQAVCVLYGFTHEDVEGPNKEVVDPRYGVTPRCAIQGLCDFLMQRHGCDFFSKQVFHMYDTGAFADKHVILPDIRYEHDLAEIRRRGGVILKITRPFGELVPNHPWESHIDALQGDYLVCNHGTPEDLRQKVAAIISQIAANSALLVPCLAKDPLPMCVPPSSNVFET